MGVSGLYVGEYLCVDVFGLGNCEREYLGGVCGSVVSLNGVCVVLGVS